MKAIEAFLCGHARYWQVDISVRNSLCKKQIETAAQTRRNESNAKPASQSPQQPANIDINWIIEAVSDKLAKKIAANINKEELRDIISSILESPES